MKTISRLALWFLTLLGTLLSGCAGQVRYTNGKQNLQLNIQPADKSADMQE